MELVAKKYKDIDSISCIEENITVEFNQSLVNHQENNLHDTPSNLSSVLPN